MDGIGLSRRKSWTSFLPSESQDFLGETARRVHQGIDDMRSWYDNRVTEQQRREQWSAADPRAGRAVVTGAEADAGTWTPPADEFPWSKVPWYDASHSQGWGRQAERASHYHGPTFHDTDPEGRPLNSLFIAGLGEHDQALTDDQTKDLAAILSEGVFKEQGHLGEYRPNSNLIVADPNQSGTPDFFTEYVIPHETGHAMSALSTTSGYAPEITKRLMARPEWKQIRYEMMIAGRGDQGPHAQEMFEQNLEHGVSRQDALANGYDELTAEAIRDYMKDPAGFKKWSPTAAKALREIVNTHPELSKYITLSRREVPGQGYVYG